MLTHMRTSIDIPDPILAKAKQVARNRRITLRELVIEGLRHVLTSGPTRGRFRLQDGAFGEGGMVEGLVESDWDRIRELAYEGRGG